MFSIKKKLGEQKMVQSDIFKVLKMKEKREENGKKTP